MDMSIRFPNLDINLGHIAKSVSVLGFDLRIYGILIAAGMLLGILFIELQARRKNQDPNLYLGMTIVSLIGGLIGARLYYVAFSWDTFSGQSWKAVCDIRNGGLAIYGGIFVGALFGLIFCRIFRLSFGRMADISCIGLLIGQIIGIWGNFFNRASFGEYTESLFAMQIPVDAVRVSEITKTMQDNLKTVNGSVYIQVHPLFFYEFVWCLLLLIVLLIYSRRKKYQGEIFTRYLAGYGLGKIAIEWLRTDALYIPHTKIPVSLPVSVVLFVVCAVMATTRRILSKKREAIRRRRREAIYGTEEKHSRSYEDMQHYESVQDEFRDILSGVDQKTDRTDTKEEPEQKDQETSETAEQQNKQQSGSSEKPGDQQEAGQTD